jgi:CRP/FNR family transcriptional regulator
VKAEALKNIYLFKDMTDAELSQILATGTEKSFIAGQELFFSGQKAESFFIVIQGTIKIFKSNDQADEIPLATIAAGEHFGEMAFLTREPRSATAQAVESSLVFEISYDKLQKLLSSEPLISEKFHRALARFLAHRLKSTTLELISSKDQG